MTKKSGLCLGASVLTLMLVTTGAAFAQEAEVSLEDASVEEIIITATRRNERLQDVPVTVTAITNEQIEELQLKQFEDIQVLSPGLSFRSSGNQGVVTSLRGISSTVTTSAPPAVVIYFNEIPVNDLVAFKGIYDIGQIEVLRGPQGTLRGISAPVGSITIGTRRPDLNDRGGTVIGSYTDESAFNAQVAYNLPIIEDKLAIRVAGLYDNNENGGVRNPTTGAESSSETMSFRGSVAYQPTDALSVFGSYQYLSNDAYDLTAVQGAGFDPTPTLPFTPSQAAQALLPAGYNGPVIADVRDRLAVQEQASPRHFTSNTAVLNTRLDLTEGAVLNYILGYTQFESLQRIDEGDTDIGNAVLDFSPGQLFHVDTEAWSHELRIDSVGGDRFWDYSIGLNHLKNSPRTITNVGSNGAISALAIANPPTGPATLAGADIFLPETRIEKSIFASSTFHLPTRTDVTVGARRVYFERDQDFILWQTTNGVRDTVNPLITQPSNRKFKEWVFDARVVQRLDDDKIVYFSYGRGFRGPGANRGVPVPSLPALLELPGETSDSYELGFKGDFFDRRLRFNADVFQQDYKGFNSVAGDVPFCPNYAPVNVLCAGVPAFNVPPLATSGQVVFAGDARVRGFEAEISGRITDRWTASATVAYAKGNFQNAQVPFRPDLNGDGNPDTDAEFGALATQDMYFAASNGPISEVPKWIYTIQSEYTHPLGGEAEAYVRGLFSFRGKRSEVSGLQSYDAEPVLNLYVGAREWIEGVDITLFARNVFDTQRLTSTTNRNIAQTVTGYGAIDTGYQALRYMAPREIGVTARYAFGGG